MPKTGLPWQSDRLRLLAPLLTERVIELATRRVIMKEKFFKGTKLNVPDEKPTVKLALLLVMEMNPREDLQLEEEAVLCGIDSDTLAARKKERLAAFR